MSERFGLIDVTLRDGHQCLWSTRMTTAMMTPIIERIDAVGYEYINILGGAVFDVCVRYLHENPFERVGLLCDRFKTTPCDGLTRGQSLYTFELFPDDVVALNSFALAERGIKVLTVYDALNDNRNIESSVRSGHEAGMQVNAMMTYTLSPVHDDAYYVARTKELVALGVEFISVKDPTGLLTPERAKTLFPAVVAAAGTIPVQLHSHCQSGLAPEVYSRWRSPAASATATRPRGRWPTAPRCRPPKTWRRAPRRWAAPPASIRPRSAKSRGYFRLAVRTRGPAAGQDHAVRPGALRAPGARRHDLQPQGAAAGDADGAPPARNPGRSGAGAARPRLPDPGQPLRPVHHHPGGDERGAGRALQDHPRRGAQVRHGLLRPARGAARGEFLERAKLKPGELVSERPGEHVAPSLPRLRRALGAAPATKTCCWRPSTNPN
jgi:oxaloacetate decarboxylase alpha subunit